VRRSLRIVAKETLAYNPKVPKVLLTETKEV